MTDQTLKLGSKANPSFLAYLYQGFFSTAVRKLLQCLLTITQFTCGECSVCQTSVHHYTEGHLAVSLSYTTSVLCLLIPPLPEALLIPDLFLISLVFLCPERH